MVQTSHVNIIVAFLIDQKIKEILPGIDVSKDTVTAYLQIADKDYPDIGRILVRSSATQIHEILAAIANFDNDQLFILIRDRMLPEYTEVLYSELAAAGINIGMSCDMLREHIKAANEDFPENDIAASLMLLESPVILKQAIDSVVNYDNNKLNRYLMYIEYTYLS